MKRMLIVVTILLSIVALAAGCVDREQLKTDLTQALARHTEMNNYTFSGTAQLLVEPPNGGFSTNPLTAGLLSFLLNSQVEWSGIASVHPLQVEADIRVTPRASSKPYEIPLLIKDNKMYIHIPAVNTADQYVELDFQALSELSGKPYTAPKRLSGSGELFAAIAQELVSAIDSKQFDERESPDYSNMTIIEASLGKKQSKEAIRIWFDSMPSVIDRLLEAGYMDAGTADKWKSDLNDEKRDYWNKQSDNLIIGSPLVLSALIDEKEFIREMKANVDLSIQSAEDGIKKREFEIVNRYGDINASPAFTREVPEHVISFTEILKLMSGKP